MKKLLLLLLAVYSLQVFAQEAKITGTVSTAENRTALSNASVTLKDKVLGTTTNATGNFAMNYKGKLPVTLVISALGSLFLRERQFSVPSRKCRSGKLLF